MSGARSGLANRAVAEFFPVCSTGFRMIFWDYMASLYLVIGLQNSAHIVPKETGPQQMPIVGYEQPVAGLYRVLAGGDLSRTGHMDIQVSQLLEKRGPNLYYRDQTGHCVSIT